MRAEFARKAAIVLLAGQTHTAKRDLMALRTMGARHAHAEPRIALFCKSLLFRTAEPVKMAGNQAFIGLAAIDKLPHRLDTTMMRVARENRIASGQALIHITRNCSQGREIGSGNPQIGTWRIVGIGGAIAVRAMARAARADRASLSGHATPRGAGISTLPEYAIAVLVLLAARFGAIGAGFILQGLTSGRVGTGRPIIADQSHLILPAFPRESHAVYAALLVFYAQAFAL